MKADVGIVILGLMFVTWGCFDSESESDLVETQSTADTSDAAMEPETSQPWPLDLYLDLPSDILTQDLAETLDPDLGDMSEVEDYEEAYAGDGCETIVPQPLSEWQGAFRYTTKYELPESLKLLVTGTVGSFITSMQSLPVAVIDGISIRVSDFVGESISNVQFEYFLKALEDSVVGQLGPGQWEGPSGDIKLDELFGMVELGGDATVSGLGTVESELELTAAVETVTVYWSYGCLPGDQQCPKRDLPLSAFGTADLSMMWSASLLEEDVLVHKHYIEFNVGLHTRGLVRELLLEELFEAEDLGGWADEKLDCAELAVDLAAELQEIGVTPGQLVEFCLDSRDVWLSMTEGTMESLSMPVTLNPAGEGQLFDDDEDALVDRIEGDWHGVLSIGTSAGELFTGHFKAIKN
jgi:hypothetical protein